VDIAPAARRHGVSDEAMRHAVRNPVRIHDLDERLTMYVGSDEAAND